MSDLKPEKTTVELQVHFLTPDERLLPVGKAAISNQDAPGTTRFALRFNQLFIGDVDVVVEMKAEDFFDDNASEDSDAAPTPSPVPPARHATLPLEPTSTTPTASTASASATVGVTATVSCMADVIAAAATTARSRVRSISSEFEMESSEHNPEMKEGPAFTFNNDAASVSLPLSLSAISPEPPSSAPFRAVSDKDEEDDNKEDRLLDATVADITATTAASGVVMGTPLITGRRSRSPVGSSSSDEEDDGDSDGDDHGNSDQIDLFLGFIEQVVSLMWTNFRTTLRSRHMSESLKQLLLLVPLLLVIITTPPPHREPSNALVVTESINFEEMEMSPVPYSEYYACCI